MIANITSNDKARKMNTFGSETTVRNVGINKLSFYLKCCHVGCGVGSLRKSHIDYNNAHKLPDHLQDEIYEVAMTQFKPRDLLNKFYFVDDNHKLLPSNASNSFFDFDTLFNFFTLDQTISGHVQERQQVMLCTTEWLREYYLVPIQSRMKLMKHKRQPENVNVQVALPQASETMPHEVKVLCHGCKSPGGISGTRYSCMVCQACDLCESCYMNGEHDHTHKFFRHKNSSCVPEQLPPRAEPYHTTTQGGGDDESSLPIAHSVPIQTARADLLCPVQTESSSSFCDPTNPSILASISQRGQSSTTSHFQMEIRIHCQNVNQNIVDSVRPENLVCIMSVPEDI